jgi:hypothetical protein
MKLNPTINRKTIIAPCTFAPKMMKKHPKTIIRILPKKKKQNRQ